MLHVIFTLDYEIYGNGTGRLRDLVLDPAERLRDVFEEAGARFVNFVEVAEFMQIEAAASDEAIGDVARQIRRLHDGGFEVGLHLHPQWFNASLEDDHWVLDPSEYNLCTLSRGRIETIVDQALAFLRRVLGKPEFTPLAFRAGNWLFQPTATAASVLASRGLKIDSSVFKGGLQRGNALDYRAARWNGPFWRFSRDVNVPEPAGQWLEVPIHTEMVPFWRMVTGKRVGLQTRAAGPLVNRSASRRVSRFADYARFRYPLKFDFCRMTMPEMTRMLGSAIQESRSGPEVFRPLVAIGHTKDLVDVNSVASFLRFLRDEGVAISTFEQIFSTLQAAAPMMPARSLGA